MVLIYQLPVIKNVIDNSNSDELSRFENKFLKNYLK